MLIKPHHCYRWGFAGCYTCYTDYNKLNNYNHMSYNFRHCYFPRHLPGCCYNTCYTGWHIEYKHKNMCCSQKKILVSDT